MLVVAEVRRPDGSVARTTITAQALPKPDTANRLVIMSGQQPGLHRGLRCKWFIANALLSSEWWIPRVPG